MNKRANNRSESVSGVPKQKERHIVSWSQEEDDILREQIRVHGTVNWTIIASNFKDKTTRQCRRRWFTYLNSDFKKGGWSLEEDMLLCEAQKLFGNRWTEIAKVVSGRTDNAVKNRFTTLCKRRAKHEALAKGNSSTSFINLNNKRVVFPGGSDCVTSLKRTYTSSTIRSEDEKVASECDAACPLRRHPIEVVAQNAHRHGNDILTQMDINHMKGTSVGAKNNQIHGTFLKKDDPKVLALMQQAELLSSLAIKVNSEKTDLSLENAWMVIQNILHQNKESGLIVFTQPDTEFQHGNVKELEDLRSSNDARAHSWREPGPYESSPTSSEYSSGSTLLPSSEGDEFQVETCTLQSGLRNEDPTDDQHCLSEESGMCHHASVNEVNTVTSNCLKDNSEVVCEYSDRNFSSPVHVTPLFRAMAATIPSPKFSESEKHFLMKTLGMESNSPSRVIIPSQPPPCKRSLLHCL